MPLTEEQREIRRHGVTGSEVAVLVGLNSYKSPQQLWEEKLGMIGPDPELENNPHIERGVYLEPALINWTQKRVGYAVYANNHTYVSKEHPLIIATPDGFADPEPGRRQVVEVKAPSPRAYEDWADPDEIPDGIPPYYIPQVSWEMAATGTKEALVSTLIGGNLRVYRVQRNDKLIEQLLRRAEVFWSHVEKQDMPPVDFARQIERDWLKKHLRNQDTAEMKEFLGPDSESIEESIKEFMKYRAEVEAATEKMEQAKSMLTFFVGDHAGFTTDRFKVTWKQSKPSWKTDWKRFMATLAKAFPDQAQDFKRILQECDYSADGSRRFLVSEKKGSDK